MGTEDVDDALASKRLKVMFEDEAGKKEFMARFTSG